jgi:hypothetical protein
MLCCRAVDELLVAWGKIVFMHVSPRLTRWVTDAFPSGSCEQVLDELRNLPPDVVGRQDPERIQAALVLRTGGDWNEFVQMRDLAIRDWRDALVAAGLAHEDWPERLSANLD